VSRTTVLIIDDDDVTRLVLRHQLGRLGHDVIEADSPAEALAILSGTQVDLIISDHDMPGMSGLELRDRLGPDLGVPFVLLTGFADADELGGATGALSTTAAFLTKPVSSPALGTLLTRLLLQEAPDVEHS
jgi:CheY-like chemotaxis protein